MEPSLAQYKKTDDCIATLTAILDRYTSNYFELVGSSYSAPQKRQLAREMNSLYRNWMLQIISQHFNESALSTASNPPSTGPIAYETMDDSFGKFQAKTDLCKSALSALLECYALFHFKLSTLQKGRFFAETQKSYHDQLSFIIDEYFKEEDDAEATVPAGTSVNQSVDASPTVLNQTVASQVDVPSVDLSAVVSQNNQQLANNNSEHPQNINDNLSILPVSPEPTNQANSTSSIIGKGVMVRDPCCECQLDKGEIQGNEKPNEDRGNCHICESCLAKKSLDQTVAPELNNSPAPPNDNSVSLPSDVDYESEPDMESNDVGEGSAGAGGQPENENDRQQEEVSAKSLINQEGATVAEVQSETPVLACLKRKRSLKHKQTLPSDDIQLPAVKRVRTEGPTPNLARFPCVVPNCGWSFNEQIELDQHLQSYRHELNEHDNASTPERPVLKPPGARKRARCTWNNCTYEGMTGNVVKHIRGVHFKLPETLKKQAERNIIDHRNPRDYLKKI